MNIFKEARTSDREGMGYRARRFKLLWQNKKCSWNWFAIEWGIRWSDKWQIFPIANASNNSARQLRIGVWKLHATLIWHRKHSFNQSRKLVNVWNMRKLMQLVA